MNGTIQPGGKWDERIDEALRSVGSAGPEPGIEGRILTRLAAQRIAEVPPLGWRRYSSPVLGFAAASLICAVIVGGSVEHSPTTPAGPAPPVLSLPGQGVGAASAVHPAAPVSTPLPVSSHDLGRSAHSLAHGRARIAPHAHKARGVVVPAPAANPQN